MDKELTAKVFGQRCKQSSQKNALYFEVKVIWHLIFIWNAALCNQMDMDIFVNNVDASRESCPVSPFAYLFIYFYLETLEGCSWLGCRGLCVASMWRGYQRK